MMFSPDPVRIESSLRIALLAAALVAVLIYIFSPTPGRYSLQVHGNLVVFDSSTGDTYVSSSGGKWIRRSIEGAVDSKTIKKN
jgi:hypothetical protein